MTFKSLKIGDQFKRADADEDGIWIKCSENPARLAAYPNGEPVNAIRAGTGRSDDIEDCEEVLKI